VVQGDLPADQAGELARRVQARRVRAKAGRDDFRARRLVARRAQPRHDHRSHAELLLHAELPRGVAQDGSRAAQAR